VSWWEALILGVIQGTTEFLPVSSSGHLVIGQRVLGLALPGVIFEVAVHVATLGSVGVAYRSRLRQLVTGAAKGDAKEWRYIGLLMLATVPAGVIGLTIGDRVEALFEHPMVVAYALLITGLMLWTTRAALAREPTRAAGVRDAILIGVAQAFALIPGISRSGATVVMALWLGIGPRRAAAFSFLMAIPAILGAAVLKIPDLAESAASISGLALATGTVAAAVTGVFAIRFFVSLLQRRSFHQFAWYCWAAGLAFLAFLYVA